MKDETYAFISDVKDKKITARSARNTRTHCGKGGRVRFPSDNLSKKELQQMNGECKSYRLNDPMTWKEFKSMPDDIKITYIKLLRKKFKVPFVHIGKMMGVAQNTISKEILRLGLSEGQHNSKPKWDKEGFWAWVNRVSMTAPEEDPFEPAPEPAPEPVTVSEEPEAFVEDDLPFEEPDTTPDDDFKPFPVIPVAATPCNGSMQFQCPADQALNMLSLVLGKTNCAISVMWRVIEDDEQGE